MQKNKIRKKLSSRKKKINRLHLLTLLVICSFYAQFLSTGFVPLLPKITEVYTSGTNHSNTQLLIAFYLLGFASAQIFSGTLADYFGRRKILLIGISISIFGSVVCLFAPTLLFLFFAFYFQAFGVGFIIPIENVMISESDTDPDKVQDGYSYINVALCIGGIVAPSLTAFIADSLFISLNFVMYVIVGVLLLYFSFKYLPETASPTLHEPILQRMKTIWLSLFTSFRGRPVFTSMLLYSAATMAITAAFNTAAPIFMTEMYHLPLWRVGVSFMVVNTLNSLGLLAALLLYKVKRKDTVLVVCAVIFIVASIAVPLGHMYSMRLGGIPYVILIFFVGLVTPVIWFVALNNDEISAPQSAALIIFWQNIFSVIASSISSYLSKNTQVPIGLIFLTLSIITLYAALKYRTLLGARER